MAKVREVVLPTAMIAGGFNRSHDQARMFFQGYEQGWRRLHERMVFDPQLKMQLQMTDLAEPSPYMPTLNGAASPYAVAPEPSPMHANAHPPNTSLPSSPQAIPADLLLQQMQQMMALGMIPPGMMPPGFGPAGYPAAFESFGAPYPEPQQTPPNRALNEMSPQPSEQVSTQEATPNPQPMRQETSSPQPVRQESNELTADDIAAAGYPVTGSMMGAIGPMGYVAVGVIPSPMSAGPVVVDATLGEQSNGVASPSDPRRLRREEDKS